MASLVEVAGAFYGATPAGGANDSGTIFRIDTAGNLTTLHSFQFGEGGVDGALIAASDGALYGTNTLGFFRTELDGTYSLLHTFSLEEGTSGSRVVQASDGFFYGVGEGAGANFGTFFRIDSAGVLTPLYSLQEADGAGPAYALVEGDDGFFYGSVIYGGANGWGTVFRVDASGSYQKLKDLDVGECACWALIKGTDGDFYGTTGCGGANNLGTVCRMDTAGNVTTLHSFDGFDGESPQVPLLRAADGSFYGTTPTYSNGPSSGTGVIFRLTPSSPAVNAIAPSSGPAAGGAAVTILGGGFQTGASFSVGGEAGADVTILDPGFLYGTTPTLSPGTLNDVTVSSGASSATLPQAYFADFLDVPQYDIFHDYVETIFRAGITAGCGGGNYCRDNPVRRDQMAVFLLKAEHGSAYAPPSCTGVFPDTPCPGPFTDWVEQLAAEQITGGCGNGNYCPGDSVTRAQMSAFLLKTEDGPSYTPPACAGVFGDVACPSQFADWIERLYVEEITGGCSANPLLYCPSSAVTRGQMAVFLTKAFGLP
jgi:uncharacterized repeat protein (TIGR03803 family)